MLIIQLYLLYNTLKHHFLHDNAKHAGGERFTARRSNFRQDWQQMMKQSDSSWIGRPTASSSWKT
jgi:hypothetical protein